MTIYGLTQTGFKRKRYADIILEKQAKAKELFGSDVNLSESSPLGLFIQLNAWEESQIWEVAEDVYYSAYLHSASGVNLDRIVSATGVTRLPAFSSVGTVTITGTNSTYITKGTLVETSDKIMFKTDNAVTIGPSGSVGVTVTAVVPGSSGNLLPDSIVGLTNPIVGISSITNSDPITGGTDPETDTELRTRYLRSLAIGGALTTDSIQSALINTPGVFDALVRVNNKSTTEEGRPPKSFEAYVIGGTNEDIGMTIFNTAAAGIQPYGTTQVTIQDASGRDHIIGFTRSPEIPIHVKVTLTTDVYFPADGLAQVKSEILSYIGGQDSDGTVYGGVAMGETVVHNQLIQAVLKVRGVVDAVVKSGKTTNPTGTVNIPVVEGSIAMTDPAKIVVV